MKKYAIVLAAGKGTRMKSLIGDHTKVSYPIMGKPIIEYVLDTIKPLEFDETIVVAGFGGEITRKVVGDRAKVIQEDEVSETASSVNMSRSELEGKEGLTLIIYGDLPLLTTVSIERLFKKHLKNNCALTIMTSVLEKPEGYARIIRDHKSNAILSVKEENKCGEYQKDISEVNPGVYVVDNKLLFKYLDKSVYTISEIVEKFVKAKEKVETYVLEDAVEIFSINDRVQLAYGARVIRKRVNHRLMLSGVSIEDPDTAYISPDIEIGPDTIILPNTTIMGKTKIGCNNWIGPDAYLNDVTMENNNVVSYCWMNNVKMGNDNHIGPYSKLTEVEIGDKCSIDSFVELNKKKIKTGLKVK